MSNRARGVVEVGAHWPRVLFPTAGHAMAKQQEAYDPQTLPGIDLTSLGFCYEVTSDAKVNQISWCCDIGKHFIFEF